MAMTNAERQKRFRDRRKVLLAENGLGLPPKGHDLRTEAGRRRRIWRAIAELSGQWQAAEVAKLFEGTDEAILVAERLDDAQAWLNNFAKAFRKSSGRGVAV